VELINWRGVVAPPNISDEAKTRLTTLVDQIHNSPGWKEQLERNGWTDTYLAGPEFQAFLEEEQTRIRGVLTELGLVT
jgi:putative tricarboxylic transport membrane protein